MSELSNLLQKARLDKKLTVKEVSKATRVIETYIDLIEEGRFKDLPSYIHAYGFVKKYAEYLGFDYAKDIEPLFSQEYPKPSITETLHQVENKLNNNKRNSSEDEEVFTIDNERLDDKQDIQSKSKSFKVLLILIILALGIYGGYLLYKNNNSNIVASSDNTIVIGGDTEEEDSYSYESSNTYDQYGVDNESESGDITGVTEDNGTQERMVDPLLGVDNSIPQQPENTTQVVTVRFSEDCWFKYDSDLHDEREYNAKRGNSINIEFNKEFSITMGNAIAVSLHYKDQYLGNFGERDSAKFNVRYVLKNGKLVYARNNY